MNRNRIRICGRNTSTLPAPGDHAVDEQAAQQPARHRLQVCVPSHAMPVLMTCIGTAAQLNTA